MARGVIGSLTMMVADAAYNVNAHHGLQHNTGRSARSDCSWSGAGSGMSSAGIAHRRILWHSKRS